MKRFDYENVILARDIYLIGVEKKVIQSKEKELFCLKVLEICK